MWTLDASQRASTLWWWQRYLATKAGMTHPTASPRSVVTAGVMLPTADRDESLEGEDVVVAAGERL